MLSSPDSRLSGALLVAVNLLMLRGVDVCVCARVSGGATGGKHTRGAGAGCRARASRRAHVLRDCS